LKHSVEYNLNKPDGWPH